MVSSLAQARIDDTIPCAGASKGFANGTVMGEEPELGRPVAVGGSGCRPASPDVAGTILVADQDCEAAFDACALICKKSNVSNCEQKICTPDFRQCASEQSN